MRDKYSIKVNLKRFFFPQEWKSMYDLCNKRQKFTLTFLINTGARIQETQNVLVSDIDFERKNIMLRKTKVRARLKETKPSPRIIPTSTQHIRFIRKYISEHNITSNDFLPILSTPATDIFLKKRCQEAKIKDFKDFSAHNIRKTTGNYLLALGVDGFKVAQFLGHSAETLRKEYASPDIFSFKDKEEMKDILDDLHIRMRGV